MNYYEEIKNELIKNEVSKKVREYVTNKNDLNTYYEVGRLLSMAGKHYGEGIIKEYSIRLTNDIGLGYGVSNLKRMRQFYNIIEKGAAMPHHLSWSHILVLLPIKDINIINYYICISEKDHLSYRELNKRIKSNEYQRLPDETKQKLINDEKLEISDSIKEPIILHKNKDYDRIDEFALKEIIMNDLDNFLKQLGDGFTYVGNEYKIKIGNSYNYIDLLLFNYLYNAFVVIELKISEVKKQDIGQIMIYKNYIDEHIKSINMESTIGIIVARENNKYIIKYSTDKRIMVTTYKIV